MVTFIAFISAWIGASLSWRFPWYREVDTDSHFGAIYPEPGGPFDKGFLHRALSAAVGGIISFPFGYGLSKVLEIWLVACLYFLASIVAFVIFLFLSKYFKRRMWSFVSGNSILALWIAILFFQPYLWFVTIRTWAIYGDLRALDQETFIVFFSALLYMTLLGVLFIWSLIARTLR
jgi:hypothetical protein